MSQDSDCHKNLIIAPPRITSALVALGSNQPWGAHPPASVLEVAYSRLVDSGLQIVSKSRSYSTPAFPPGSGDDYVNAAVALNAGPDDDPKTLLDKLHQVEASFGRTRQGRWASRVIDLDLIGWGELVLPDKDTQRSWAKLPLDRQMQDAPDQLIVPHPRVQDRAFVLVPLADIAPDWRHPITGVSVIEMLDALPDHEKSQIRPL